MYFGDLDPDLLLDTVILGLDIVYRFFDMNRLGILLLLRSSVVPLASLLPVAAVVIEIIILSAAVTAALIIIPVLGRLRCALDLLGLPVIVFLEILSVLVSVIVLPGTVIISPAVIIPVTATVIVVITAVSSAVFLFLRCALGAHILCHCFLRYETLTIKLYIFLP